MNYVVFLDKIKRMFNFRTDDELQNAMGLGNGYCWKLRNGKISYPDKIMKWLEEKNVNKQFFSQDTDLPNYSPIIETHAIPLLRQKVSCGPGVTWNSNGDNFECLIEPYGMLSVQSKSKKIYAFRAKGISMTGIGIQDGDILFFDGSQDQEMSDGVYVFGFAGEAFCKLLRFERLENKVMIFSVQHRDLRDVELVKTVDIDSAEFKIFGRVLAWLHENTMNRIR